MKHLRTLLILALFSSSMSFAQTDSTGTNDLESQYLELKDKSNNYQIYKVVKETSMDGFWNSVEDTLSIAREEIGNLKKEVSDLKAEVQNLNTQVTERDANIESQATQIENMDFLGMSISKGSYVAMTWSIIFALVIVVLVLFMRFKSANKITVQTRKEHEALISEFEAHKQKARETESKIKRDLQTEINMVVELKQKLGDA